MIESLTHRRIDGFERFTCPCCQCERDYQLEVHTPVTHTVLGGTQAAGDAIEYVRCLGCDATFRSTILAAIGAARPLTGHQRAAAARIGAQPETDIVAFTSAALTEIRRLLLQNRFEADTAVRLSVERKQPEQCVVQFDTLELNDIDFLQRVAELFFVIDRRELPHLRGGTLDYRDDRFALDFVAVVVVSS
jgi:Fe-S cluster assembly iron-binding protein IscA